MQREWRAQTVESRRAYLAATPWKDSRPLQVLAGDSHVELGRWHEYCQGAGALRNCGLSSATIEETTILVAAVPDREIDAVALMCGINNLMSDDPVAACVEKYDKLLRSTRDVLKPQRILVISVMPLRESVADRRIHKINQDVSALNQKLEILCSRHSAFYQPEPGSHGPERRLSPKLTIDGLAS